MSHETRLDQPQHIADDEIGQINEHNLRILLPFELAPEHLRLNPFIRHGYRGYLTAKLCFESIFWWTNETINIWSHLLGWILFLGITIKDSYSLTYTTMPSVQKIMIYIHLISFQISMILSATYHIFSCRSRKHYECFLTFDLIGVALAFLAIFTTGIVMAFICQKAVLYFYLVTVLIFFLCTMVVQIPQLNLSFTIKVLLLMAWAVYGSVPCIHWCIYKGGFRDPEVLLMTPRILGMYFISGVAFTVYVTRVPERFCPGWVDYVGSSHQWWHILIVMAFYFWYETGIFVYEHKINAECW